VLLEVLPVVHDSLGLAVFGKDVSHLVHLLLAVFDAVDADVADEGDASSHTSSGTGLAVFDSEALLRLDTELLAGVEVDFGVGLARGRVQGGGGRVDLLVWEVLAEADLVERGNDTWFGRGADDSDGITLLNHPGELVTCTWAFFALLGELLSDGTQFPVDVFLKLLRGHLEVVLLLEVDHHATEVLTDEVFEEGVDSVAFRLAMLLEQLVGEVCTSFEGKTLRETESIITVQKNVLDL
jgi:hypothetical protein